MQSRPASLVVLAYYKFRSIKVTLVSASGVTPVAIGHTIRLPQKIYRVHLIIKQSVLQKAYDF